MRGPPTERSPAALLAFGVVNLDKPPGPSAHQVAGWVREFTADALADARADATVDRVAHAGTLDPKVTGSLPVLLGDAARLARVFDDATKEYVAVLELQGPAPADFESVVAGFEGELYQRPPRKSAVRRRRRVREVYDLDVLERRERRALLRVRCESGTYIRKLCHDIGMALGTGAHMGALRRVGTAGFDDTDLVGMETFVDALAFWVEGDPDPLREVVDPAERVLVGLPRVTVAPSAAREIAQGAPVYAPGVLGVRPAPAGAPGDTVEGDDGEPDGGVVAVEGQLVACYTPDGAAVCLGRLVGDPDADSGTVVDLERVLV
jgi:H/ACA ribonucleoprotein complex subunit 4